MKNKFRNIPIFITIFFIAIFFFTSSTKVNAFSLSDIVNGIKNFFTPQPKEQITVSSNISLVRGGDLNKNGKIDSGDTIRFSYTITNTTNNTYKFSVLNTNVNTKLLNEIDNVQGSSSINTSDNSVSFPYITINPNQVRTLSFDAHINFNKEADQQISTEPTLVEEGNKSLAEGDKQSITANKMDQALFNKFVHIEK